MDPPGISETVVLELGEEVCDHHGIALDYCLGALDFESTKERTSARCQCHSGALFTEGKVVATSFGVWGGGVLHVE